MLVLLCLSILHLASALVPISGQVYSAHLVGNQWQIMNGKGGIADGIWTEEIEKTGWNRLEITTEASRADLLQAYAAGYLEGSITQNSFWLNYQNFLDISPPSSVPKPVLDFVNSNMKWMESQILADPQNPYWHQVRLTLRQNQGLLDGYNAHATEDQQLSMQDVLLYQLSYELGDIQAGVMPPNMEALRRRYLDSHCSVLVRVSDDGMNLFASHVTWAHFRSMFRLYKIYDFAFQNPSNAARIVSFPSYPGQLYSGDDYYLTSQELVVTETTNGVMNSTLYKNGIKIDTVPFWIRVMVANRMANGGKQWQHIFGSFNSGTYNNQWQVVDFKLFSPGRPLPADLLWIGEQIPGYYVAADQTKFLDSQKYWPSYNIPYYPFVYNISGYPAYFEKYGNEYSYSECARAKIFRRDQGKVNAMSDMQRMMRYNKYQTDPLSLHDACRGISARCDLNVPWEKNTMNGWAAFGGTDAKLTSNAHVSKISLTTIAISGPTWDDQAPFAWTGQWQRPRGHPKVFDFDWQMMSPSKIEE